MTAEIRPARSSDAGQMVELMALLGHQVDVAGTLRRLGELASGRMPQLVAVEGDRVLGLCGLHRMTAIHRDEPVGRITILVVREDLRGSGLGRALVAAAERHLRERRCRLIEITSNDRLTEAHAFYRHMGYERTSLRFAKTL